ncbi:shikimate dehydrogenase [Piscinibacter gummiphilus]|uniref:Shikimate dehydrogenase (NADP(+)) n=1 Tax=Piscinibacter gummiphilus TaxID=946333 RepID=A0ABZ0CR46_9BURK|nr:shikimate dehydrogenase [Piscinibacter gummiphilus]WOB07444.1 shikimate dehydrogenase [Piscinibacter gummiphilus]
MSPPDRYVVAGNPVEHSQSPFIHAQFAQATGQAVAYDRLLCPLDGFEATVQAFAESGGRGCNVTVPFKIDAYRLAARRSRRATLAQAANVLRFDAEGWYADNSDGIGLVRDIERNAGIVLKGRRVLLVGAGGAAAGALGPLIEAGPQEIVVANRSVDKAEALVQRHAELAHAHGVTLFARSLQAAGKAFDVVINATATSLNGAAIPVPASVLSRGGLALDMMYGPATQGFLQWAEQHGAKARDGLGMLVEQAAEAFHIWRGINPETAPVLAALRARLASS